MFRRTLSTFSEKKQIARVIEWKRNLGHGLAITPSGDQLFIHRSMILGEDGDRRGLLLHQMVMVATDGDDVTVTDLEGNPPRCISQHDRSDGAGKGVY